MTLQPGFLEDFLLKLRRMVLIPRVAGREHRSHVDYPDRSPVQRSRQRGRLHGGQEAPPIVATDDKALVLASPRRVHESLVKGDVVLQGQPAAPDGVGGAQDALDLIAARASDLHRKRSQRG